MSRFVVGATWADAPHLSATDQEDLLKSIPPYQRDARAKGIPQLGAGAIYPFTEEDIAVAPFDIPATWPHGFGMDVGWNRTAGLWLAKDPKSGTKYAYSEYYKGEEKPIVHSEGFKARGGWIPGRIDPAARQRSQKDGERLIETYRALGLKLDPAINTVESGILDIWTDLSTGKIKIFKTLRQFFGEIRMYQRDEKGHIKKTRDHLMDCLRYGGRDASWWTPRPLDWREDGTTAPPDVQHIQMHEGQQHLGWMA